MSRFFIVTLLIQLIFHIVTADVHVNIIEDKDEKLLGPYVYNEKELKSFTDRLKMLKAENENLRKELEEISSKFDNELETQKNQLTDFKDMLAKTPSTVEFSPIAKPKNCAEALDSTNSQSGVFYLYLDEPNLKPFKAYCLKAEDGGAAWTVLQRRQDGTINFYRDWVDYKYGFGNLYGEHWLGLDRIHALTKSAKQELWIQLRDFDGEDRFAKYDNFVIGSAEEKYLLKSLGTFTGDANDSLKYHLNSEFSTKDNDNDADKNGSCAITYEGAWWFKSCSDSDLNGQYLRYKDVTDVRKEAKGIEWFRWRGHYSLQYTHMAIRAAK